MIKQKKVIYETGWILNDGQVLPFEFKDGKPVRWLETSYFKQGYLLKDLSQDFKVQLNYRKVG